jgi:hypothetical protein
VIARFGNPWLLVDDAGALDYPMSHDWNFCIIPNGEWDLGWSCPSRRFRKFSDLFLIMLLV